MRSVTGTLVSADRSVRAMSIVRRERRDLNREFGGQRVGDTGYAREELVAELGAAYLCADLGITPEPREAHSAYLAHWIALWYQRMVAVGSRTAMRRRCVRKTAVGEEKQDLSRSQISRRRLTMTSRLWPSVGVMTARARPPNRRTAGAPRTAMRRRFSRMCRCSAARRPLGVVCCRRL